MTRQRIEQYKRFLAAEIARLQAERVNSHDKRQRAMKAAEELRLLKKFSALCS